MTKWSLLLSYVQILSLLFFCSQNAGVVKPMSSRAFSVPPSASPSSVHFVWKVLSAVAACHSSFDVSVLFPSAPLHL